ncbi:splicing factor 3A subunit 1-like [Ptychodera flava]|uniref:splicing factor 3A subunit 1-like n=1 Tax=Ptychodera flava TaxID=63121 RepID=UPI003969F038
MPAAVADAVNEKEEVTEKKEDSQSNKPIVGIIYPPPEVRNIVDKTASFVARNGPEFETRIRQNEINNPKFNFLNPNDPYHAYYRHKVKDFQEGKASEPQGGAIIPKLIQLTSKPASQVQVEPVVPKEPPPEYEFIADPPSIAAYDLDVVKLTAQFVARNGRQFLTNLMNREQRNYQFDFLRPQHSLFHYFTKLVEQYTKVLIPPKDLMNKLKDDAENPKHILDQVKHRVDWAKHEERLRKKEAEERERERVAYAQIEWHDFVVVETVDVQPNEPGNFPPPTTPERVGARILAEERYEIYGENDEAADVEMEVESEDEEDEEEGQDQSRGQTIQPPGDENTELQDMDEGSSDEDEPGRPVPPMPPPSDGPPPLPPMPAEVEIRKDYDPKAPKQTPVLTDKYLISPITGEKIPADKMQEHMRIGLLDPRWKEQRDRSLHEKAQEEVYAPGSAIDSSLKQLAERRTDIFGEGDVETAIGKKIGEEDIKPKEKVAWDGHTASMEATINKAKANISLKEQIEAIHKARGLTPDEEKEKIGPAKPLPIPIPMMESMRAQMPPKQVHKQPPPPPPQPNKPPSVPLLDQRQPVPPRLPSLIGAPGVPPGVPPMGLPPRANVPPMPGMAPPPPMRPPPPTNPPFFAPNVRPPGPPQMMQFMGRVNPTPPTAPPPQPPQPPQQEPNRAIAPPSDEPPAKKQKTEDTLMPEQQYLAKNPGPVTFKVQVPNLPDKPEWKLSGQSLSITLPITDQVSVIKAKLFEELSMPTGKQKLQLEGMFIKDSNSLAFYNMSHSSVVQLQLKERGGRKR